MTFLPHYLLIRKLYIAYEAYYLQYPDEISWPSGAGQKLKALESELRSLRLERQNQVRR